MARIKTPIGLPDISGKEPATIAVSVAADLLRTFEREREREGARP
jgi:xanthine dehydrogenase accessory factor